MAPASFTRAKVPRVTPADKTVPDHARHERPPGVAPAEMFSRCERRLGRRATLATSPRTCPSQLAYSSVRAGFPQCRHLTKEVSMSPTIRNTRARRVGQASGAAVALSLAAVVMAGPASAAQVPSASVANDTLTINGTQASELLALRLQAGAPGILQVDFGDDGTAEFSFDRATFSHIDVH